MELRQFVTISMEFALPPFLYLQSLKRSPAWGIQAKLQSRKGQDRAVLCPGTAASKSRPPDENLAEHTIGEVLEWLNRTVSKTVEPFCGSVSSNLTLSAYNAAQNPAKKPGFTSGLFLWVQQSMGLFARLWIVEVDDPVQAGT